MSGFFEQYYGIREEGHREETVLCPFPHHTSTGATYYESHPSAHVNLKERVFHCKVCNEGYSEIPFIKALLQCTYANASRISTLCKRGDTEEYWMQHRKLDEDGIALCHSFGITDEVIEALRISCPVPQTIMFPAFLYGKIADIRRYTPSDRNCKILSTDNAPVGLVLPFDIWQQNKHRVTLICAGEKDMAVARSHGFNAITITGGENALPLSPTWFRDTNAVIVYDNDDAGRLGAYRLANYLMDYCRTIKVCTNFHEVCKENKEDITDFFNKYGGTKELLINFIEQTPYYTKQDVLSNATYPMVTLQEATHPKYIGKLVRSNIQVAAISEVQYTVPLNVVAEKTRQVGDGSDTMQVGDTKEWELSDNTVQDILHLMDNNFKSTDIDSNLKTLMHIYPKEKYVRLRKYDKQIVYKAYVTEMVESMNTEAMPLEYTCYSLGTRLESGKKYMVTYKIVPHPYKGQSLIMLITNAVHANDSVSNFVVTPSVKEHLSAVQELGDTITDKVNALVQKAKGILGYDGNNTLITVLDLAFHTVLSFHFGTFKDVRGYLDTLVVGESRVGKSSTADMLRNLYQLGTFTSLAGNSATIPGLVGGSNKTAGGTYQTKAGLIPQNHKGLIIFEEFGKCNSNIVAELTDIRSSNEVRITRVSGTLSLPAMVRMISLSNVKSTPGEIKSIASYPNGISIVTELVSTAEDIARYDLLTVLGDKGNTTIDPFWKPEQPLPTEVYQDKIRWVWSRSPEQIIIDDVVGHYIIEKANALNDEFNCHIKIFGTEAWKKLSRLSIAIAGYTASTDETYENIVVTKECVDYAVQLFYDLYDNTTFRLREYVANERRYNVIDDAGVQLLQEMYQASPALLMMLEQEAQPSRQTLMAATGLPQDRFNGLIGTLTQSSFIRLVGQNILPTERFRKGMALINKNARLRRYGENA